MLKIKNRHKLISEKVLRHTTDGYSIEGVYEYPDHYEIHIRCSNKTIPDESLLLLRNKTNNENNFTYNYYFNNEDICDSVVVFENACLECARRETETELILFLETWLKVANNEYEKSYTIVNPRKIFSPKTKLFIKLVADPMPSTGECKKWIFTLKNRLALSD